MPNKRFYSSFILLLTIILISSCQFGRMAVYNFADIKDYKIFPFRPLQADSIKYNFKTTSAVKYPKELNKVAIDKYLEENKTVAFMIIKNDTIQYEKYFNGYNRESIVNSFSMAKSVTSILIGCAIDEGLIKSVDEPITNYIPELKKNGFEKVTIKHLLQMTSGIKFNESYINPFSDAATFYYGNNIRKEIKKMRIKNEPGTQFKYASGNSQLLGLVLERSLKDKTVTQYLQEKLWTPLGMEYDATWSIDKKENGLEKTFCCLNARARDFAKIGRLYNNKGNWDGKQIVSEKWVEESTKRDSTDGSIKIYQYQWWLPFRVHDFTARGNLGQYVYGNPVKNLIVVRLGKKDGKANWWEVFSEIAAFY